MRKVSVLMSIYNETQEQIKESVSSVLSQDYKEFEFIIVLDNPDRTDVKCVLDDFNDKRIVFVKNPSNIGLAMSMNKAAGLSDSEIYIRMDADDVCLPGRFRRELEIIESGNYDFVFTNYDVIDEQSKVIRKGTEVKDINDTKQLYRMVSLDPSIIHHPTVMFTKKIFEDAGGYRDFPCSQDSDLWLRMTEIGCRFYKICQPYLQYRVNTKSVSRKRWFKQQLTCNYIFDLSMERLQKGSDSFSVEGYNDYLQKWKVNDQEAEDNLRKCYQMLSDASLLADKGHWVKSIMLKILVFTKSPLMRKHYISLQKKKRLLS